jgi:hygromycin-B 4-O-kinase
MRAILPSFFDTLDAMRSADVSSTSGYGLWDGNTGNGAFAAWRDFLLSAGDEFGEGSRLHGWRARLDADPSRAAGFDAARAAFRPRVDGMPEERHLFHGDLFNRNVFTKERRITAVIDWGCGAYGDFLYELAGITFWSPWFPALDGVDLRAEALRHYESIGLDVAGFEPRLTCCEVRIGIDAMTYSAYRGRWEQFDWILRRTQETLNGPD